MLAYALFQVPPVAPEVDGDTFLSSAMVLAELDQKIGIPKHWNDQSKLITSLQVFMLITSTDKGCTVSLFISWLWHAMLQQITKDTSHGALLMMASGKDLRHTMQGLEGAQVPQCPGKPLFHSCQAPIVAPSAGTLKPAKPKTTYICRFALALSLCLLFALKLPCGMTYRHVSMSYTYACLS